MTLTVQGVWEGQMIVDILKLAADNGYVSSGRVTDLVGRLGRQVAAERKRRRANRKARSKAFWAMKS